MARDLYECGFCFTRQKLPYKFRDQLQFPCKHCKLSIDVLSEYVSQNQKGSVQSILYQAGAQHKIDFGGPWGIPWPVFVLIVIHHSVLLWEVYSLITEFAAQPNLIIGIVSSRLPQILGLLIIVCGFHFRWQWFWSCIRTVLIIAALFSAVTTAFTCMWLLLNNNQPGNQFEMLPIFLVSLTICGLSFTEYYFLGLPSTRAYFGFACPSCNSLLTRISLYNTDNATCLSCKLNWRLSKPPKIKELHLIGTHINNQS
jgi:hypothetical protein